MLRSGLQHFSRRSLWPQCRSLWQTSRQRAESVAAGQSASSVSNAAIGIRDPVELATRVASLQLLLGRWVPEVCFQQGNQSERIVQSSANITQTAVVTDMIDFMTEEERALLHAKLGSWTAEQISTHEYDWEALGTLQWALGIQSCIPAYTNTFDRGQLFLATDIQPALPATLAAFIDRATSGEHNRAVSSTALTKAATASELWYWRARAQSMLRLQRDMEQAKQAPDAPEYAHLPRPAQLPAGLRGMLRNLPSAIAAVAARAHAEGAIPCVVERDFAVAGDTVTPTEVAYASLADSTHYEMSRIAAARRQSFAWMTGRIQTWDEKISEQLEQLDTGGGIWAVSQ